MSCFNSLVQKSSTLSPRNGTRVKSSSSPRELLSKEGPTSTSPVNTDYTRHGDSPQNLSSILQIPKETSLIQKQPITSISPSKAKIQQVIRVERKDLERFSDTDIEHYEKSVHIKPRSEIVDGTVSAGEIELVGNSNKKKAPISNSAEAKAIAPKQGSKTSKIPKKYVLSF
jgi:hypothetical protein